MSAFAEDCREKAARYAERASGYRAAGDYPLANLSRMIAIELAGAAKKIELIERVEVNAAERLQA